MSSEADYELALVPELFPGKESLEWDVADPERIRTLDIVARWLVRDLVERAGERSAGELTDAAFAVLHPELAGRRIEKGETALIADYNRIKTEIVGKALAAVGASTSTTSTTSTTSVVGVGTSIPALGGPSEPKGYKPVLRARASDGVKVKRGLARYSGDRLETTLRGLMAKGVVSISEADLDTFQRIANVETSGGIQALNTWDSAVVSIGFFQLTLQHGKLQRWIARAPDAFKRYGIELDPGRKYKIGDETPIAIKGAPTAAELRWNGWAERFYLAGLDPDVIAAEVELGKVILQEGIRSAKRYLEKIKGGYELFTRAYQGSLPLRGLYQEALNNKPVGARNGIQLAMKRALAEGATDPARIYQIAKQAIYDAFVGLKDKSSGDGIVKKTAAGLKGN